MAVIRLKSKNTRQKNDKEIDLEIITLNNMYQAYGHPLASHLFGKMIALKADGYGPPNYPASTLPLDIHDFICWHHLFCIPTEKGPLPIAGFKHSTLEICDYYHLVPPYLTLALRAEAHEQSAAMEEVFRQHREKNTPLICSGGFTILKEYRGHSKSVSQLIKELVVGLMVSDHIDLGGATLLGGGVPKFKTDEIWQKVGFNFIQEQNGERLPPIKIPLGNDELMYMMLFNQPTQWAQECYERHQDLIHQRRFIGLDYRSFQKTKIRRAG